jgi:transcriptional regulator with XRE-family HTH domain
MSKANAVAAEGEGKSETPARASKADPVDVAIGRRVRRFRTARGLSQTELGTAINVTFQQIQKYEAGTNRIAASTLLRIASALGVEPTDLLSGTVAPLQTGNDNARPSLLSTPGAEALLTAYAKLESDSLRRALLALVREMSGR